MEVLFWLLPAAVLTVASMAWVAWWGREGRGQVDRETAARRLGEALAREQHHRPGYAVPARTPDRHTGVALRPSRVRPVVLTGDLAAEPAPTADPTPSESDGAPANDRRAS